MNPFTLAMLRTVVTPYYSPEAINDDVAVSIWASKAAMLLSLLDDKKSVLAQITKDAEKEIIEKFILDGIEVIESMKDSSEFRTWLENEVVRLEIFPDVKTMKMECVKAQITLSSLLANLS